MTRSAVSRQVAQLEQALATRLLQRTTRRLRLTEAGERFFAACARIVAEARTADRALRQLQAEPKGLLRVTAPVIAHDLLVDVVGRYLALYPEVGVDLVLDDHYLDLVAERFDLAIRIGHAQDSSLVARRLARVPQVICGAPSYFARHGVPRTPDALAHHEWLIYSLLAHPERLSFVDERGGRRSVRLRGRLRLNGGPALRQALLDGLGLALLPRFYLAQDIRAGRLRPVLESFVSRDTALYSVYPHREHLPAKVRRFIELFGEVLPAAFELGGDEPTARSR